MVFPVSKEQTAPSPKSREAQKTPSRSFKSLMENKPTPQQPKWSVFDFPKQKQNHSTRSREKPKEKKTVSDAPHTAQQHIQPSSVTSEGDLSSVSELSPAMQDLLSKMEDYVTLESRNGVSTIEMHVELSDSSSLLQGTEIRIVHYDTHPHSFNIELANPTQSAVDELTAHLPALLKCLQAKLEHFQIHLLPPAFPKLPPKSSSRKVGKAGSLEKKSEKKSKKIERNPFLN